jgi:hypothetical protein
MAAIARRTFAAVILKGRTAFASARTGRCKAGFGSFGDQVALRIIRERGEDAERHLPAGAAVASEKIQSESLTAGYLFSDSEHAVLLLVDKRAGHRNRNVAKQEQR